MALDPISEIRRVAGDLLQSGWEQVSRLGAIRADNRRGRAFGHFGAGTTICFPVAALFGEGWIHLGADTLIGPYSSLSAGVSPGDVPDDDPALRIGDRCVIGRGTAIVAHSSVHLGDDVWTGHQVYITDANHGYEDVTSVPGVQFAPSRPVRVENGAWLGHGTIVLPGSTIGEHAVIGAGSVVAGDIPAYCVAVGSPARVIRTHVPGLGWRPVAEPDVEPTAVPGNGVAVPTSPLVQPPAPSAPIDGRAQRSPPRPDGALTAGPPHGES